MLFKYFLLSILVFALPGFAQAKPEFCEALFPEPSQLAQNYKPYIGLLSAVPPWRYAKALLNEPLSILNTRRMAEAIEKLDRKKMAGASFLETIRSFNLNDADLMQKWADGMARFSNIESHDTEAIREERSLAVYLRQLRVTLNWIRSDRPMTEGALTEIHFLVMKDHIDDQDRNVGPTHLRAGHFRKSDVMGGTRSRIYPKHSEVQIAISDYLQWYQKNENHLHPLVLAANSYRRLVSIQPFLDGNKRVARWISNYILIKNGYPPLLAPKAEFYLNGMVFGSLTYAENESIWDFYQRFFGAMEFSFQQLESNQ